jgi:hypothetical protein
MTQIASGNEPVYLQTLSFPKRTPHSRQRLNSYNYVTE